MNWNNKTVIITGSSIGIGRKVAKQLAEKGANVVLNARNEQRLQSTLEHFKSMGFEKTIAIAGDVSKPEDCQNLIHHTVQHFGQLDVLINNAGISMQGDVGDLHPDVSQKVMSVNYLGRVYPTKYALPYLRESKGSVLFVSSVAGIRGVPGFSVYSASKMALTALAESLRIEEKRTGVHVGIAYVGFTENDPEKSIYDADGKIIAQPSRRFIKQEPVDRVANRLIRMVENRKFKQVFTPLGKLNAIMNRFFPFAVDAVLTNTYHKRQN
jgi:short-subunit dehydrogenase